MTATPSRILKWAGQGGIPGGTVGVTAPTAPVRGLFAPVRGAPETRCPRTHSGRQQPAIVPRTAYALVSGLYLGRRRAVCKTVGSAYVGSNPTPATTCGNGPLAADTRPAGRFLLVTPCIVVRHRESMRCGVHGRIADGVHAIRRRSATSPRYLDRPASDHRPMMTWP